MDLADADHQIQRLKQNITASQIPEEQLTKILDAVIAAGADDTAMLLQPVARVEVGPDYITIWTILDTDPTGQLIPEDDAGSIKVPDIIGDTLSAL